MCITTKSLYDADVSAEINADVTAKKILGIDLVILGKTFLFRNRVDIAVVSVADLSNLHELKITAQSCLSDLKTVSKQQVQQFVLAFYLVSFYEFLYRL